MKPAKDLKEFIERLSSFGMLKIAEEEVDSVYQLASMAVKYEKQREGAVLFKSVKGYEIPIIVNLYSEIERAALAFGVRPEELHEHFIASMRERVKPLLVDDESWKEEPSLDNLPIPVHSLHDGGRYITGIITTKVKGIRVLQFARLQVKGPHKLVARIDPDRRVRDLKEEVIDIGILIGAPPAVEFAAAIRGFPYDKLELAGALQGSGIVLMRCKKVECEVPMPTQIVIEGRLYMNDLEDEGPFGEFTGYYSPPEPMPKIRVERIVKKPDAIYRTICGGSLEHVVLNNVSREAMIYDSLRRAVPGVKDVFLPPYGCGFVAILSIKEGSIREAKNALLAALSAHPIVKYAIVVDEDIDIRDEREVIRAMATRSGGDSDVIQIPKVFDHVLDPASENGFVYKLGIDATFPLEKRKKYRRVEFS